VSVQKRGSRYVVRWRDGGRQLRRTFIKHGDAVAFETDVKRRQQLGALAPGVIQSPMTLAEFVREEWWPRYAGPEPQALDPAPLPRGVGHASPAGARGL
jgi:hypothetical protein